ncbi:MAG TPA: RDD family protein [Steroidobacteraceae bacterium]|jgi:uncharacterized RDD family membrane protein YckC
MKYPNVLRRYLATLIDLFAWWCLIYAMSRVPSITEHGTLAYALFALSLLLYEPVLTTYACTLGQAVMRIRVRTQDRLRRVRLDQALGRMIVKYLLGIISLLTIPARADRRAIHDLAANTIVIEAASDNLQQAVGHGT